jgi:hypothetical protein
MRELVPDRLHQLDVSSGLPERVKLHGSEALGNCSADRVEVTVDGGVGSGAGIRANLVSLGAKVFVQG